jgi:hypothetical protein
MGQLLFQHRLHLDRFGSEIEGLSKIASQEQVLELELLVGDLKG